MHGRLDLEGLGALHRKIAELPLVSISNAQRAPLPWASRAGTVRHGPPLELHCPHYDAGRYLVFLGRISPEKRGDRAIAIALRARLPLKIAAKVDPADREYFVSEIKPLLDAPSVEFLGEIAGLEGLLCGFRRPEGKAPTSYPVACSPQTWSAAAVFAMLQACLELAIDPAARVSTRNLTVGGCRRSDVGSVLRRSWTQRRAAHRQGDQKNVRRARGKTRRGA